MGCFRKLALSCLVAAAGSAQTLTKDDVARAIESAAKSVDSKALVIAVTDRQGDVLAVYRKPEAPSTAIGNFGKIVDANELAVALARTAGFFSNGQAPLSSRTVRFISGVHFPPGVLYTGNAALYGIENTNRGCYIGADYAPGKAVPPARSIDGSSTGLGIITGKADLFDSNSDAVNPGGVPLYKDGQVVGGIGVVAAAPELAEHAAFMGSANAGLAPTTIPAPGVVFIDGIALPFVDTTTAPGGIGLGTFEGDYVVAPQDAPGPAPEGDLVIPRDGPVGGLTATDVRGILDRAIEKSNDTRAVIRLPLGSKARMVIAVADLDGTILGLHRMEDATFFSIDVALAKARNVIYFSSKSRAPQDLPGVLLGTAVTNRTIGYGAQPFFPVGLDFTDPGPFFKLYTQDVENPCTQGSQEANGKQNGVVFFPGALPLYKNGVLVGGLGVSGDGVEQDDYVSAAAALGFEPPASIRADRVRIDGVRLPYLKFPRNPEQ
jgi:uncharacterized protein GlcG (DUF336 family)